MLWLNFHLIWVNFSFDCVGVLQISNTIFCCADHSSTSTCCQSDFLFQKEMLYINIQNQIHGDLRFRSCFFFSFSCSPWIWTQNLHAAGWELYKYPSGAIYVPTLDLLVLFFCDYKAVFYYNPSPLHWWFRLWSLVWFVMLCSCCLSGLNSTV